MRTVDTRLEESPGTSRGWRSACLALVVLLAVAPALPGAQASLAWAELHRSSGPLRALRACYAARPAAGASPLGAA